MRVLWLAILAGAGLLSACSSMNAAIVGSPTEPPPENYRQLTLAAAKQTFFDPYSIRDAEIGDPQWLASWNIGQGNGWVVCVRANAKSRMGAYIGLRDAAFLFKAGKFVEANPDLPPGGAYYCGSARYVPFTELNDLS